MEDQYQLVARFLDENSVSIIPEGDGKLGFVQYAPRRDLGYIEYDHKTGEIGLTNAENLRESLQLQGMGMVRKTLGRLIRAESGDFYAERMNPIHEACEKVESRFPGK